MSWFIRLGCLCCLLAFVGACDTGGDVGNACKLTQDENKQNLKTLDRKARIVEASAACDILSFCFANFYDPEKESTGLGYCSKECDPKAQDDCPKGFKCEIFVKAKPPKSHADILAPIVGKPICIKEPPEAAQP